MFRMLAILEHLAATGFRSDFLELTEGGEAGKSEESLNENAKFSKFQSVSVGLILSLRPGWMAWMSLEVDRVQLVASKELGRVVIHSPQVAFFCVISRSSTR